MKISSIQFKVISGESKADTFKRMGKEIDKCKDSDVIVLPELWNTGFYSLDKPEEVSEETEGDTFKFLSTKAKELKVYIFGGTFIEKLDKQFYNTCLIFGTDGKLISKYSKIHLVSFGSKESELLSPGNEIVTVKTEFGTFGVAICYDLRFPELFRKMSEEQVEYMVIMAAWAYPRIEHWKLLSKARAIENSTYVIACNCVGMDSGKEYFGHSVVIDPWGEILAGSAYEETIINAKISSGDVYRIRDIFPPLKDRVMY